MKLTREKYLLQDEFKRLIYQARVRRHINAPRDYALLVVAGLCGLRIFEVISLRVGDLLFKEKPPLVRVTTAKKRRRGSTLPVDETPVPMRVVSALQAHLRGLSADQKLPWSRLFPITTRQVENIFKFYAAKAGLNPRYSAHSLRHFRGVIVYEQTKDLQLTKDALRHATIQSTQIYVHTVEKARIAAVDIDGD